MAPHGVLMFVEFGGTDVVKPVLNRDRVFRKVKVVHVMVCLSALNLSNDQRPEQSVDAL